MTIASPALTSCLATCRRLDNATALKHRSLSTQPLLRSATETDLPSMGRILLSVFLDSMAPLFGLDRSPMYEAFRQAQIRRLFARCQLQPDSTKIVVATDGDGGEQGGAGNVLGFVVWILDVAPRETSSSSDDSDESNTTKKSLPPLPPFPPGQGAALYQAFGDAMSAVQRTKMGDRPRCYLKYLCVDPTSQRKGVGTALLSHVCDDAEKAGLPIYLEAAPTVSAGPFYKKFGFEDLGVFDACEVPLGMSSDKGDEQGENKGQETMTMQLFAMKLETQAVRRDKS